MSETFELATDVVMPSPPAAPSMRVVRSTVTLRQQVLEVLRDAILNFQFKPGDRLIERELCEMTGVSRTSVREALRHLESEGLVRNLPNRGPIVATLSIDEARQIYEVRRALEGLAARLFAERAGAEQHAALDGVMTALERAFATNDTRAIVKATAQFYDVVLGGCGNEVVRRLISSLHARVTYLRATSVSQPGRAPDSLAEMRRLVAALKSGNPDEAQAVCVQHIDRAAAVGLAVLQMRQTGTE